MEQITVALIAGIATIVAAALALAVSFDKRSKLLKTIEVYEKMNGQCKDEGFDSACLLKLRREIEWQIEMMVNPKGAQFAMLLSLFIVMVVVYCATFYMSGLFERVDASLLVPMLAVLAMMVVYLALFYIYIQQKRRKRFMGQHHSQG